MTLQDLFNEKPTKVWLQYEDDGFYDREGLLECDKLLDGYLNQLLTLEEINPDRIMGTVEKLILALNDVNHDYDYFIETSEREELIEFIKTAAKLAGLDIEDGHDITLALREW
ncbi:hypothetical protein G8C92_25790 [Paenibacillus donghaensis]|uniref:hypothetical protein n=1 Tax=Paenibacillus donghaensis TaxID=414771 RepID=UPI001884580C|nr:hypothetical protein [Paenibacillus donghaensis]MBE9917434.1 hypothetical protein [Paenibacillus donghaensis]